MKCRGALLLVMEVDWSKERGRLLILVLLVEGEMIETPHGGLQNDALSVPIYQCGNTNKDDERWREEHRVQVKT